MKISIIVSSIVASVSVFFLLFGLFIGLSQSTAPMQPQELTSFLFGLVFTAGGVFGFGMFYMIPTIIAEKRGNKNFAAIALVNIVLGWTLIGWIGTLVASLMGENETRKRDELKLM